jgi:ABC-type uncharacterized transport system ATPase component
MAFQKGNQHGQGRPKGSQNKTTAQIREYLMQLADAIESDLINDIELLSPGERVKTYLSIMEYLLPKLSRQNEAHADNDININISYPE